MDLATLANTIWSELSRAQADREHPWRTPVLASVDSEGLPQARSVVLRKVCSDTQTLQIYTDSRSPKVKQLQTSAQIQLVFWSSSLNWQLRVSAQAKISRRGPDVDAAWQQVKQSPARQDYLSPLAPGDTLDTELHREPSNTHHLAIISATVTKMDWLSLSPAGHQRAEISGNTLRWLSP
ncbi:pyridoxamine 5'-phosphate oxidase family protein [Zhongshania sp.]|jgi:hypothetical protein|uniref:pyridoxamine 5'-phosphate oxidase family protein n=1 Tax=Zhongshania sp. TaxID=1971902 RepID=UPI001B571EF5|nr:pyridoxamine 5'-phosphate oxidase family protein [Zhongshania sp.]MBQ0759306.1 pyridoxamine 5'-phosphate oxidase family protein [Zhongshania sp.]MBQ0795724.1 pyridoxamine 5'-phosphate oxidase family protein [Zhongshania sp.]|tara:strand:+ start:1198 stop:1737 length:540 start_codon:yes stop_codon:yes gene_type:complete